MKIRVQLSTPEPGSHFSRNPISYDAPMFHDIPDEECKEARPDYGEYFPIVTFSAIERALTKRDLLPFVSYDHRWWFSIVRESSPVSGVAT